MRGYKPVRNYTENKDKLLCAVSYLTFGWAGFLWLAITHFKGKYLSPFARFHVFQAIFLYAIIVVFNMAISVIGNILGIIPFIGGIILNIINVFTLYPLIFGYSLFDFVRLILYIYLPIMAVTGRYGKVPYISDMVRQIA